WPRHPHGSGSPVPRRWGRGRRPFARRQRRAAPTTFTIVGAVIRRIKKPRRVLTARPRGVTLARRERNLLLAPARSRRAPIGRVRAQGENGRGGVRCDLSRRTGGAPASGGREDSPFGARDGRDGAASIPSGGSTGLGIGSPVRGARVCVRR